MAIATSIRRHRALQAARPAASGADAGTPPSAPDAETAELLRKLCDTCADSAYGFACCADHSNISQHRALFRKRAQEYDAAREQLRELLPRPGATPPHSGGVGCTGPHRGWVAEHGTLCGLRDSSLVAECERGEALSHERFQQALQHAVPGDIRAVLEHQLRAIAASLRQVRALREALSATRQGAA